MIIPAFNEEAYLEQTIKSINKNEEYEIIVVDNGSTDASRDVARQLGVKVLEKADGTIASLRNAGANAATGEILVIIDADVNVSKQWHTNIGPVIESLSRDKFMVTGSRCRAPESAGLVNKHWYAKLVNYDANYINSGYLITTRSLFEKISEFSEHLETAEDYDFCQKAIRAGARIQNDSLLAVTHEGYLDTLSGFIKRERWHGSQDVCDWDSFKKSRTAWLAALNLALFSLAVIAVLMGNLVAIPVYLLIMFCVPFVLAGYKFGIANPGQILVTPIFFYFYLYGRSLSIFDRIWKAIV